ncbi:uncharacterized protein LOC129794683 isoform X1 [Lutzomyia longipalpis]|uniref:uncharacterized protein LOC129794683 isoform X1 n=1 Tax=Lutzomyia longipalpis TaxID=7200 RepID=UPI0024836465|nr:uncharacterized protein LOC129794683 isoform X1 [Lutzomyia longipalpis]
MWNKLFKRKSTKALLKLKGLEHIGTKDADGDTLSDSGSPNENDSKTTGIHQSPHNFNSSSTSSTASSVYDSMFENATEMELEPCQYCGRTFVPSTLEKHVVICEKTGTKKRKQFDSSQQRLEGTELARYVPKSYGLSNGRESRVSPPKTNTLRRGSHMRSPSVERRSSTQSLNSIGKESVGASGRKRTIAPPQAEKCPYCERSFGMRAYDRHVEWCGEKAKLIDKSTSPTVNAAKERLNARINYKAPSLRTKRGLNREKYSPGFDDSYSECGTMTPNSIVSCNPRIDFGRKNSTNSMTSSITSESGFSDKYDPFVSAKRQLEELFSPSQQPTRTTPTAARKSPGKSPQTNGSKPSVVSPTAQLNQLKTSNFRRTSSLRMPKKSSPPKTFYPSRPAASRIQRGISDEGPISSSFVKPEEYDEMPVRSVYATDYTTSRKSPAQTPTNLQNRRNLRLDLKKTNLPSNDFPISKTDSLAVFLNYERDLKAEPSLTQKELKDKSNSLRSQQKSPVDSPEANEIQIRPLRLAPLDKVPKLTPITLDQILKPHEKMESSGYIDPKLINLCDNLNVGKLSSGSSETVSSSGSRETMKTPTKVSDNRIASNNQRNASTEKKAGLRRQLKLDRNNILFDMAPRQVSDEAPTDPYSDAYDQTIELLDGETKKIPGNFEELFNDFDFEEFLTSFEDDEQFPIFRDYKELMLNRQRRAREKTNDDVSHRSPPECRNKSDREDEEVVKEQERMLASPSKTKSQQTSEATEEEVSSPEVPSPMQPIDTNYAEKAKSATTPKQRDSFEEAEQQLMQSVRELDLMCTPEDEPKTPGTPSGSQKLCKFCHECGSRFPVETAKFCMECGVRRITM